MSRDKLILTGYLLAYAVIHTVLSTDYVKARFQRVFPLLFRFYRFKLHSIQCPDAGPHTPLPETLTTALHSCRPRFQSSQSSADPWAIGFMLSLKAIDVGLFVGLRSPNLEVPGDIHQLALSTSGPYRLCRHPLYFFASLFLAAQPSVSVAYAIFTTWTLAYF